MIVWGWNTTEIKGEKVEGICSHCSAPELFLTRFQKMFTLFWIPTFPLSKTMAVECGSCGSLYPSDPHLISQSKKITTPWWSYSGSFIIVGIIALGVFLSSITNAEHKTFLENPKVGNYFVFKSTDEDQKEVPYTFGKIERIEDNKIYIRFSNYSFSKRSMASKGARKSKLNSDNSLQQEVFDISKDEFRNFSLESVID